MKAIKAFREGSAIQPSTLTAFFYATKVIIYSQIKENSKENFMKTTKRQTFYLEGNVYSYRITKSALLRYEQASGRKILLSMTLTQIVRALYYVTCMLPYGITEQYMVEAYRKGNLRTRKNRGEYSLRGIRSLLVHARRELIGMPILDT